MRRVCALLVASWAGVAGANNYASGEVMIVEDNSGAQHDPEQQNAMLGLATTLCQFASKGLYSNFADIYDGVVMFTTHPMTGAEMGMQNVMRGNIVRQNAKGISGTAFLPIGGNPATAYGSPAQLAHCVYMGAIGQLPGNPDDQATMLFGGFIPIGMGITGVELVGHEYGHNWLVWATYDKNDGKGKRNLMRGDEGDAANPLDEQPNGHWNHYSDARSVMYGSFVTPLGGSQFRLQGGVRKYNHFDQYFMGLRGPSEVSPILIVDDGSGRGAAVQPLWRNGSLDMSGTPVMVDVQDVIRSLGPRDPAYPNAQKCFRVAFVLVAHGGHVATPAEIAKVNTYRTRFESWFNVATDGRGHMDTRLTGASGCISGADAGTPPVVDAGQPADAGVDGGTDAGRDAGTAFDAGIAEVDAGPAPLPTEPPPAPDPEKYDPWAQTGKLRPGCGCNGTAEGGLFLGVLGLLALARRRRPTA